MKVLVCGSRSWNNRRTVYVALDELHARYHFTCVMTGAYHGIDNYAEQWARNRCIKYIGVPANWRQHGLGAGPIRNQRMIDEERPELGVAFPGGDGTADMVRRLEAAKIELVRVPLPVNP